MARHRGGFARHPRCGSRNCPRVERADEVMPGDTVQFRGYHCPTCSRVEGRPWYFLTAEKLYSDGVHSGYIRRLYAEDFEDAAPAPEVACAAVPGAETPPRCATPPACAPLGVGVGTSAPREAPMGLRGEMRGRA